MLAVQSQPCSLDHDASTASTRPPLPHNSQIDLDQVDLLSGLNSETRLQLLSSLLVHKYKPGEVVFLRGTKGQSLYFVQQGVMDVIVGKDDAPPDHPESRVVDQIGSGSVFGEMALLLDMPRTATICASTDAVVYELQRVDFMFVAATCATLNERLQNIKEERFARFRQDLEKAVVAKTPDEMDPNEKAYLLEVFKQIDTDNSNSIDQNELAVMCTRLTGRFFSHEQCTAMMQMLDQDGNGTIEAQEFLAGLPLLAKWLVRSEDNDVDELNLETVELLGGIDAGTRLKIVMALKKRQFKEGDIVFKKGTVGQSLFFLQQGIMDVIYGEGDADPNNPDLECCCVDQLRENSVFGEIALLLDMPRTATICVSSPFAVAFELDREQFEQAAASSVILQKRLDGIKEQRFSRFRHDLETACLTPSELDEKQRAYLMEVFKQIDADNSGAIDQEELATMLRRLAGREFNKKQVAEIMKALDKDGNQTIEAEEFLAGLPLLAQWLVDTNERKAKGRRRSSKVLKTVWSKVAHSVQKVFHH